MSDTCERKYRPAWKAPSPVPNSLALRAGRTSSPQGARTTKRTSALLSSPLGEKVGPRRGAPKRLGRMSYHERRAHPEDEMGLCCPFPGTETGFPLVRWSPWMSLIGGLLSTRFCCTAGGISQEAAWRRARWIEFHPEDLAPGVFHEEFPMETMHKRCAGLDVHAREVVACVRKTAKGQATHEVRKFSTATRDLIEIGRAHV